MDTISDMLTRIRNAVKVKHKMVRIIHTKTTKNLAKILKEEGFIENFEVYKIAKGKVVNPLLFSPIYGFCF